MSYPSESLSSLDSLSMPVNRLDDVQSFLDVRHPQSYHVFNLTLRPLRPTSFEGRVCNRGGFEAFQSPGLRDLILLLHSITGWLAAGSTNVCVLTFANGRTACGLVAACLLRLVGVVDSAAAGLHLVETRCCGGASEGGREGDGGSLYLQPSQHRYLDYLSRLMPNNSGCAAPDDLNLRKCRLLKVTVSPVPMFNKIRTGCRPYIEVYNGFKKVFSSLQDYESLKLYIFDDVAIVQELDLPPLNGDITIVVYHARQSFTMKGKDDSNLSINPHRVCQVQFNTGFLSPDQNQLIFLRNELDLVDNSDRYPTKFSLNLDLIFTDVKSKNDELSPMELFKIKPELTKKMLLFSDQEEMNTTLKHLSNNSFQHFSQFSEIYQTAESLEERDLPVEDLLALNSTQLADQSTKQPYESQSFAPPVEEDDFFTLLDFSGSSDPKAAPSNQATSNLSDLSGAATIGTDVDPFAQFSDLSGLDPVTADPAVNSSLLESDHCWDFFQMDSHSSQEAAQLDPPASIPLRHAATTLGSDLPRCAASAHDLRCLEQVDPLDSLLGTIDSLGLAGGASSACTQKSTLADLKQQKQQSGQHDHRPNNLTTAAANRHGLGGSYQNLATLSKPQSSTVTSSSGGVHVGGKPAPFNAASSTGVRARLADDAFGEFVNAAVGEGLTFGGGNFAPQPKTMREMRREVVAKETDPEKLKVLDWTEGKERNIRALLCSLPSVLWDGVRWKGVNMAELVSDDQVKRQYKNAIRCIHQDKWTNTEFENLSRLITVELNDAMTEFDAEQQNRPR